MLLLPRSIFELLFPGIKILGSCRGRRWRSEQCSGRASKHRQSGFLSGLRCLWGSILTSDPCTVAEAQASPPLSWPPPRPGCPLLSGLHHVASSCHWSLSKEHPAREWPSNDCRWLSAEDSPWGWGHIKIFGELFKNGPIKDILVSFSFSRQSPKCWLKYAMSWVWA